jgi:hypothetical protein
MAKEPAKLELSKELEGKYELVDVHAGPAIVNTYTVKNGKQIMVPNQVDFRTMTAEEADKLIAQGCTAIKKKEVEKKTPAPAASGDKK